MVFDLLLVIFLVSLNGFFVAAEFAIVKVRASQVELKAREGSTSAKIAEHILENMNAYLSATQLGITLASLGLGWIGEPVVGEIIWRVWSWIDPLVSAEFAHKFSLPVSFALITFLHIVFGELAPKSVAIRFPEKTALSIAIPMRLFHWAFYPFTWLLNGFANFSLRLIGIEPAGHADVIQSREELMLILSQGVVSGAIKEAQHELIENVFHFNETIAKQVMVPRTKVIGLEVTGTDEELIEKIIEHGYSRMPVYKGTMDNIVGIIHTKDLLNMINKKQTIILSNILRPVYFIPETKKINLLLKDFQRKRTHIAVVLDEFGGTSGVVTMEDVIEELVGDIQDEYDEEVPIVEKTGENQYEVNGMAPIRDVNEHLRYPLPQGDDFDTIAGLMNFIFGKIPEKGEKKQSGGFEFTILELEGNSVSSVKINQLLNETD